MRQGDTENRSAVLELPARAKYRLIDCGMGWKLESFGSKVLARPSAVSMWRKKGAESAWKDADATYIPKKGWEFSKQRFEEWQADFDEIKLTLRLQDNGQIGVFPEHALYIGRLEEALRSTKAKQPKVLNLFAYTGLASLVALRVGAQVTHVDLSKKALDWASSNFRINDISAGQVRMICEDAVAFAERERRRGKRYDVVIVDPPSFSRITKNSYWKLEESLNGLMETCVSLLAGKSSSLVFTCHDPGVSPEMLRNICADYIGEKGNSSVAGELILPDSHGRGMPSGCYCFASITY
ncbi:MAG: hypothetical protein DCC75_13615 [Proteobacteria bacterium]|nr:MAG: hypothetical protein DCC75_13615 [Pseudomonadota bacterium]